MTYPTVRPVCGDDEDCDSCYGRYCRRDPNEAPAAYCCGNPEDHDHVAPEATEKIHAVDGTLAFEVGPNGDRPGVRITTHLQRGGTLSIPLDEDQAQAMALAILGTAPDDPAAWSAVAEVA